MSSEGWCNDNYLILFSGEESNLSSQQYNICDYLPEHRIIGISGWDDFVVMDNTGRLFTVPTVPISQRYMKPYTLPSPLTLTPDNRLQGKIKWHTKPVIFGGEPNIGENLTWVTPEQHVQLVAWWNEQFISASSGDKDA